jgi:hypothetical protein
MRFSLANALNFQAKIHALVTPLVLFVAEDGTAGSFFARTPKTWQFLLLI